MLKLLILLIFSLFQVSFSQDDSVSIEKYIKQIQNALTEFLVKASDAEEFERTYDNLETLLDKDKFVAQQNMNSDEFMFSLLMKKKRIVRAEVMSSYRDTTLGWETIEPVIILKLTSVMNYTATYKYDMTIELKANQTFKIVDMFIKNEYMSSKDNAPSAWTPQYLETPESSANEFAEQICGDVTFYLDTHMFEEDLRDMYFTSTFFALVDTNFDQIYDLDMFIKFMKQFNKKYRIRTGNNLCSTVVEHNDHIVFQTLALFEYDDVDEYWWFEVEAVYIDDGWRISKFFIGHPYNTNEVFENRAGKELLEKLRAQVSQSMRNSEFIQINGILLKNAEIYVCGEMEVHYDEDLRIKMKEWVGISHIYSKFDFEESYDLFIVLYYPDDFGNYTEMKFEADYDSKFNVLEIKKFTVQCPDIKLSPNFEEIKYKWITMDTKRIVIEPKKHASYVAFPDYFNSTSSRRAELGNKKNVHLWDSVGDMTNHEVLNTV